MKNKGGYWYHQKQKQKAFRRASWATLTLYVSVAILIGFAATRTVLAGQKPPTIHQGIDVKTDDTKWTFTHETVEQMVVRLANEYGVDPERALAIAWCESRDNPLATNYNKNGSNDKGIFQINSIHKVPDSCRLDAECNIDWTMKTIKKQGFQPWGSSQSCWDK